MTVTSISVVIPSYNRRSTTAAAVRSALAQTRPPDEIVVVDDGSDTPVTAAGLGVGDERLRVIRRETNGGAARARQTGIDAAKSDAIAFLDSDDVWHPDKLAAQEPLLVPGVAVSCGWNEAVDGRIVRHRVPVEAQDAAAFFKGCWFSPGSTVLLYKADAERIGPLDSTLHRLEDLEWYVRFGLANGRLAVAPVIGATIALGHRARLASVAAAAQRIEDRFGGHAGVPAASRGDLKAYLDLERARGALNDGDKVRAGRYLMRSFIRRPRAGLHLRKWWG